MKELKFPTGEDFDRFKKDIELNQAEQFYWNDLLARAKVEIPDSDTFTGDLVFLLKELELVEGMFGQRIAVERALRFKIGEYYEQIATFEMKDADPLRRAEIFEKAVQFYQSADELLGYYTDYCIRQAESCNQIANCRVAAGLGDAVTRAFAERGLDLMSNYLKFVSNGPIIIINGNQTEEELKGAVESTINEILTAYFLRLQSQEKPQ